LVGACGGKKTEEDPAKAALTSFQEFAKGYPGTEWEDRMGKHSCEISKIDVIKSDSAASPFVGILNGSTSYDMGGGLVAGSTFNFKFRNEGKEWSCDPETSGALDTSGKPIEAACFHLESHCRGKAMGK